MTIQIQQRAAVIGNRLPRSGFQPSRAFKEHLPDIVHHIIRGKLTALITPLLSMTTLTEKPLQLPPVVGLAFVFSENHHPVPHMRRELQLSTSGRFLNWGQRLQPGFQNTDSASAQCNNRRQFHLCRRSGFSDLRNSTPENSVSSCGSFQAFHHEEITWRRSPAAATGCTTMMAATTLFPSPHAIEQKADKNHR